MYKMGWTMEEVNEGWIEVTITNINGFQKLISKEKLLMAQSGKIGVAMHMH